jgi:hypothetical protein
LLLLRHGWDLGLNARLKGEVPFLMYILPSRQVVDVVIELVIACFAHPFSDLLKGSLLVGAHGLKLAEGT